MRDTQPAMPEPGRRVVVCILQARLSDALDLASQMQHAYWSVRGYYLPQFRELFSAARKALDALTEAMAERIAILGGVADGRVQTTADSTSLYEYSLDLRGANQHLCEVAEALAQFGRSLRSDKERVADLPDQDTADLLTQLSREMENQLRRVGAHIEDSPIERT